MLATSYVVLFPLIIFPVIWIFTVLSGIECHCNEVVWMGSGDVQIVFSFLVSWQEEMKK